MICVDNSEWMRNGDYSPSRFQAQADAINLICGAKTQAKLLPFSLKPCCHFEFVPLPCFILVFCKLRRPIRKIQLGY